MKILRALINKISNGNNIKENQKGYSSIVAQNFRKIEFIHYSNGEYLIKNVIGKPDSFEVDKMVPRNIIEFKIQNVVIQQLFKSYGLKPLKQFYMEGYDIIHCDEDVFAFGDDDIAIVCETKCEIISSMWLNGRVKKNNMKSVLETVFLKLGNQFELLAINWVSKRYYFLFGPDDAKDFIRQCM